MRTLTAPDLPAPPPPRAPEEQRPRVRLDARLPRDEGPPGAHRVAAPPPTRYLQEVDCFFENVRSLADDGYRARLLPKARAHHKVIALAETFCKPSEEALWERDFGGHAEVIWASSQDGHFRSRGLVLMLSAELGATDVRVITRGDDTGHTLAVEAMLYGVHRTLFIVSHAPSSSATENAEYFEKLHTPI